MAADRYKAYLRDTKHDFVFMDISIGDQPAGRLVFEVNKCVFVCVCVCVCVCVDSI